MVEAYRSPKKNKRKNQGDDNDDHYSEEDEGEANEEEEEWEDDNEGRMAEEGTLEEDSRMTWSSVSSPSQPRSYGTSPDPFGFGAEAADGAESMEDVVGTAQSSHLPEAVGEEDFNADKGHIGEEEHITEEDRIPEDDIFEGGYAHVSTHATSAHASSLGDDDVVLYPVGEHDAQHSAFGLGDVAQDIRRSHGHSAVAESTQLDVTAYDEHDTHTQQGIADEDHPGELSGTGVVPGFQLELGSTIVPTTLVVGDDSAHNAVSYDAMPLGRILSDIPMISMCPKGYRHKPLPLAKVHPRLSVVRR